jgi:hypothetical protein
MHYLFAAGSESKFLTADFAGYSDYNRPMRRKRPADPPIRRPVSAATPIRFPRHPAAPFPPPRFPSILVFFVTGAAILLASCAGNQPVATPATHKMEGTNSPGY